MPGLQQQLHDCSMRALEFKLLDTKRPCAGMLQLRHLSVQVTSMRRHAEATTIGMATTTR